MCQPAAGELNWYIPREVKVSVFISGGFPDFNTDIPFALFRVFVERLSKLKETGNVSPVIYKIYQKTS